ncbi:MAG: hypothetical protein ACOY0T_29880 [Myxococcota bacterium]
MQLSRLLLLLVPLAGAAELAFDLFFATRAPLLSEWVELGGHLPLGESRGNERPLLVVAPAWAEPLARQALGDAAMPLSDLGRADVSGYARAVEISLFGERSPELGAAKFREVATEVHGKFTLRTLENPGYEPSVYSFVDHVRPSELAVVEWNGEAERSCEFTARAPSSTGGLGGHNAYPRERFRCSGAEAFFVGVTIVDDQRYRPRRCIYAHPPINANLHLRFPRVPTGKKIKGYAGESFLIARDAVNGAVEFAVFVDAREVGRRVFKSTDGFMPFEFALPAGHAATMEVTFQIQSGEPREREFCFQAEVR